MELRIGLFQGKKGEKARKKIISSPKGPQSYGTKEGRIDKRRTSSTEKQEELT